MDEQRELERAKAMRRDGFWKNQVIDDLFQAAVARTPDKPAVIAYRADRPAPRRTTFRDLEVMVGRIAGALRAMGVGRGDVVAVQLPNWLEFVATNLACCRIGATLNPLMPILRERELGFMLKLTETKVFVVPKAYRGHDFARMARGLRAAVPTLKHVVVVDEDGPESFERRMLSDDLAPVPAPAPGTPSALHPDDPAVLMFTSGTTGEPKGVVHSENTLLASVNAMAERFRLTPDDVLMVISPVAHMIGYAASVTLALRMGATMVLQDTWEPRQGVAAMAAEGVTFAAGTPPFLADLCDSIAKAPVRPERLRLFLCAGAPIPPVLVKRAAAEAGITVCAIWGMTEVLAASMTEPERCAEKAPTSDGRALEGMELQVVDLDGKPLPVGKPGCLLVRGSMRCLGYYKRPELFRLDRDGWLDSGDLAVMDAEGYIRITGRVKDVLIRGGENVPVVEIENLICEHPAVLAVAIVGFPDRRLGERACAFIVPRDGTGGGLDLAAIQTHLAEKKAAKPYWPERVELVKDLPRTPTGKTQKFVLREMARQFGDA
jgi:cyclohexanecarboxylate-CoA ligase